MDEQIWEMWTIMSTKEYIACYVLIWSNKSKF